MPGTVKKKLHLLIAESDTQLRSLYRKTVSSDLFDIVAVSNGDSVQDAYIYKRPDILLVDANLEGKPGLDVIKWVRIARRDNDTSIFLTTSNEQSTLSEKYDILAIQAIFTKPLDFEAINALLLEHHQRAASGLGDRLPTKGTGLPLRVLIAEDDTKVAILYKKFLSGDDFSIHLVGNGAEAIASYSEWKPDVIVLDLHMPELSGQDFLMEIRTLRSDSTTTVIIATSESSSQVVRECARYDIQGYLIKPFNLKKLGSFIKAYRQKHLEKLRTPDQMSGRTERS